MTLEPATPDAEPRGARAEQVAKTLGVSIDELRTKCSRVDVTFTRPEEWLDAHKVAILLEGHEPRNAPSTLRSWLGLAFGAAKASGREDWESMTLPVFKNRLLAASGGSFDETDFGFPNLPYLVASFPNVLRLREGRPHNSAELIDKSLAAPPEDAGAHATGRRIRPDIWRGIMDYRSHATYVWHASTGQIAKGEPEAKGDLVIPTTSRAATLLWRNEFIRTVRDGLRTDEIESAEAWARDGLPMSKLSARLREEWNFFQSTKVAALASDFFSANGIDVPKDLFVHPKDPSSSKNGFRISPEADLRTTIHEVVELMTAEELAIVSLPAIAMLRWQETKRQ